MNDRESDLSRGEVTVVGIKIEGDSADVRIEDNGERYGATFLMRDNRWRLQLSD